METLTQSVYSQSIVVAEPIDLQMISTMNAFLKVQLSKASQIKKFQGPSVTVHAAGRGKQNFMPRIGNNTHCAETNNGYARKGCGGFYNH